jgi:hypothetical protein
VLPVLAIQQYALSRLRELGDGTPAPAAAGGATAGAAGGETQGGKTTGAAGPAARDRKLEEPEPAELRPILEKMVVKSLPIIVNSARNAV